MLTRTEILNYLQENKKIFDDAYGIRKNGLLAEQFVGQE